MATERWAAFSVVAHKETAALARDVLLYDKLILPYPPTAEERSRWADPAQDWDPDLLDRRLEQLKDLALPFNWGDQIKGHFHDLMATVRDEVSPLADTPRVIRDWIEPQVRERGIRVVAAFRDGDALRRDYLASAAASAAFTLGFVHEFVVPFVELNPEDALAEAVNLARDEEFRLHRRDYYRWQEEIANRIARRELDLPTAQQELRDKVTTYNARVAKADKKAGRTVLVTLAGTGAGIALAVLGPPGWLALLAVASAALPLLLLEGSDASTDGVAPAVMFHDMRRALE